jgi:hypothetical protein
MNEEEIKRFHEKLLIGEENYMNRIYCILEVTVYHLPIILSLLSVIISSIAIINVMSK